MSDHAVLAMQAWSLGKEEATRRLYIKGIFSLFAIN